MTSLKRPTATAQLVDLVTSPLDEGYAQAAARRRPVGGRRWYDGPAVALGCLLVGFTLAVAYVHTHRSAPTSAKVHADLVTRVKAAQAAGDRLQRDVQRLDNEVSRARDRALPGTALGAELDRDQLLAGATPVVGPGLRVQLGDPPAATPSPGNGSRRPVPIGETPLLSDRDVRSVVNELWHDGAEAISVNDVRLTPISAIRFAGQAVLVDFTPITSPYTIRAVGDSDMLVTSFADSDVASRYHTLASAEGISFAWAQEDTLHLPATAPVRPRYAQPPARARAGAR